MVLPRRDWALVGAAALLQAVAYPPFELLVPAYVCFVPATLLILRGCESSEPWRRHLHQGFWHGVVTHVVLLYWLVPALWRYHPVAVSLFGVACIAFGGATAALFAIVGRVERAFPARVIVALPAGVVALEWVAEQAGPIAFPWFRVALTQTAHPVMVQTADLLGSAGLGYLVVTVNACLAVAWWSRRTPRGALMRLETAGAVILFMSLYGMHRMSTIELADGASVAVVQPNVSLDEKWRPDRADAIAAGAVRLAAAAIVDGSPDLVALPETAFPGRLSDHPGWAADVGRLSVLTRTTVLVGAMENGGTTRGRLRSDNVVFEFAPLLGARAEVVRRKNRLVPTVERPVGSLHEVRWDDEALVRHGPQGSYGALICFELTFEGMTRELRRAGADVLVTVSNDGWLGRSAGAQQHFAHGVLRAVENRMTVVRSANTGVSGIVDPLGRVVTRVEPFTESYAVGTVRHAHVTPPAVRLGGLAGPLACTLLLVLAASTLRGVGARRHARPYSLPSAIRSAA